MSDDKTHHGDSSRVPLHGSELPHMSTAKVVGSPVSDTLIEFTVVLRADPDGRRPRSLEEHSRLRLAARMRDRPPRTAAAASDLGRLRAWASEHRFTEVATMLGGQVVRLDGRLSDVEAALGVKTALVDVEGRTILGYHGACSLPADLAPAVIGVLGLDGRRSDRSPLHFSTSPTVLYKPAEVAALYNFPASHGSGQSIGIITLGGGYVQSDLDTYFTQTLGLPQSPTINAIKVIGLGNSPSPYKMVNGEVCLDIEIVGGIAYEATINVYFGKTLDSQVACIAKAIDDGNSVITSSWGSNWESSYSLMQQVVFDFVYAIAADLNVTVLHGISDTGSWGGPNGSQPPTSTNNAAHAPFPCTSPWITACGGTALTNSSETVWNDSKHGDGATGGGVSDVYPVPDFQSAAGLNPTSVNSPNNPGRGIPDVASVADPDTGYLISINGQLSPPPGGGDSATGPLWAALVAILNEQLGGSVGFLNPTLYTELAGTGFNDITSGNNVYYYGDVTVPGYYAATGWDACTGWGSPDGTALLTALQALMNPPQS